MSNVPHQPAQPAWRQHAYDLLRYNAPLSQQRAQRLVALLAASPAGHTPAVDAVDLGCGWGTMLLDLLEAAPSLRGVGVDLDARQLDRGRRAATARGLEQRATFVESPAVDWSSTADRVVCVGASHAFGGQSACLAALRERVTTTGRVLLGDGFWVGHPDQHLLHTFGPMPGLSGLTDLAVDAGFRVRHASSSTLDEWDDFESDWRAGMEATGDADATAFCEGRRREYLSGYRGILGFAWLVLDPL